MLKILRFNKFVNYCESLKIQEQLVASKLAHRENHSDYLLILQHQPCITLGKRSHTEAEGLRNKSRFTVIESSRGGKATFHGPGQLTCYPIIDLKNQKKLSLECYVRNLSAVMCDFLSQAYNINNSFYDDSAERVGLWLPGNKKIGFIGIQARKWITSHGFSLNIASECLKGFKDIDPCGLADQNVEITCAEQEMPLSNIKLPIDRIEYLLTESFKRIFKHQKSEELKL